MKKFIRNIVLAALAAGICPLAHADVVTDWNATLQDVLQGVPAKANPGFSTRSVAMMNAAVYDVFQAFDRTHQPFLVTHRAPSTANLEAAVAQAAHDVLVDCYGEMTADLNMILQNRLAAIGASPAEKAAGTAFGAAVAQKYIKKRKNDHSGDTVLYNGPGGIGHWEPDPLHPNQEAWGPGWGTVHTWVLPTSDHIPVPGTPELDHPDYTAAYDMVKDWGALNSPSRNANPEATEIGLFWAYDRATMGSPLRLFVSNLVDIATQASTTPAENARMFALASIAMADASVAAWDVKFDDDFWRPIAAIRAGDSDPNFSTVGDPNWLPLGAPGADHLDPNDPTPGAEDDFTPPFPAYVSGHATMGGALFKSIELFFGTNEFGEVVGAPGAEFTLHSAEEGSGFTRSFNKFSQYGALAPGAENSPDGENGMSRIYLGVHWIFDQQDGMDLGHAIASYVAQNRFQPVPEPSSALLALLGALLISRRGPRRRG